MDGKPIGMIRGESSLAHNANVGHPLLFHLSYTRLSPWTPIRTVCKIRVADDRSPGLLILSRRPCRFNLTHDLSFRATVRRCTKRRCIATAPRTRARAKKRGGPGTKRVARTIARQRGGGTLRAGARVLGVGARCARSRLRLLGPAEGWQAGPRDGSPPRERVARHL